jgi:glycine cleavage system transcriptional repressor
VSRLAVAVLGPDRPGVVAALSEVLLADGGNLADASMTVLSGRQFAMSLVVEVPHQQDHVEAALEPVAAKMDLLVAVRPVADALPAAELAAARAGTSPYLLRLHGADRPGLVHRATALLAGHGANITDLTTRLVGDLDAPVYVMLAAVDVPAGSDVAALTSAVQELAAELDVEVGFAPADDDLL